MSEDDKPTTNKTDSRPNIGMEKSKGRKERKDIKERHVKKWQTQDKNNVDIEKYSRKFHLRETVNGDTHKASKWEETWVT